ncbi:MAG: hypothetical protein WDN09_00570 [bacterium]
MTASIRPASQAASAVLVKTTTIKPGGVEGIYPTVGGTIIGLREFISLIGAGLPIDTMPFVNENFLLGAVYYIDSGVPTLHSKEIATTPLPSPVPVVVEGKPVTLESSAFFKTGTTEFINADAKDKAEAAISLFLTDIDFTTTEINVVGTYSVERPSSKNDALAESRRKLGLDILNEVLTATYAPEDIAQMTITSSAKGGFPERYAYRRGDKSHDSPGEKQPSRCGPGHTVFRPGQDQVHDHACSGA